MAPASVVAVGAHSCPAVRLTGCQSWFVAADDKSRKRTATLRAANGLEVLLDTAVRKQRWTCAPLASNELPNSANDLWQTRPSMSIG